MSVTRPTLIFLPAGVLVALLDDELLSLLSEPQPTTNAAASTSASTATARADGRCTITELLFGFEPSLRRVSLVERASLKRPIGVEGRSKRARDERRVNGGARDVAQLGVREPELRGRDGVFPADARRPVRRVVGAEGHPHAGRAPGRERVVAVARVEAQHHVGGRAALEDDLAFRQLLDER